jgi:Fur family ferric uptake transcriptional regulator
LNKILVEDSKEKSADKEQLIKTLRANGIKITKQRRLVIDIIMNHEFHTCKDIFHYANSIDPKIGVATVYRMVKTLETVGVVNRKININI